MFGKPYVIMYSVGLPSRSVTTTELAASTEGFGALFSLTANPAPISALPSFHWNLNLASFCQSLGQHHVVLLRDAPVTRWIVQIRSCEYVELFSLLQQMTAGLQLIGW